MAKRSVESGEYNPLDPGTAIDAGGPNEPGIPKIGAQDEAGPVPIRVSSPGRDAWLRFRKNYPAMVSLVIICIMFVAAFFPWLVHASNPVVQNLSIQDQAPTGSHWFGGDSTGYDLYSRVVYGLEIPFGIGFVGSFCTVVIGTILGLIAAYYGGLIDNVLGRFTDLMFAFPSLLLAILVVDIYGPRFDGLMDGKGRAIIITFVFAFSSWPGLARFVRGLGLGLKEQQFVEAARTSGSSGSKIIVRHLLPNIYGLVLVQASLTIVGIIYSEVVLAILDLGVPFPAPDLAEQINRGVSSLDVAPHEVLLPSIVITVMLMALSFIGDGLRDAFDPRGNA